ncbi:transposase [Cyanobacteria bacterium FACHB-63]|nr:transposase [Cyanobacteria bacterium FACHB-63]
MQDAADRRKQVLADAAIRNQIEGKFGQGKRRFSLGRVMAKLAPTAECAIAITFLVMNLEWLLQQPLFVFFTMLFGCMGFLEQIRQKRRTHQYQFALASLHAVFAC